MRSQRQHCGHKNWIAALSLSVGLFIGSASVADIAGFGDFSRFTVNQGDSASGPTFTPGRIHITGRTAGQARSVFYNERQPITAFEASFTFLATGTPTSQFGACFVVQNSALGAQTVAEPAVSGIGTRFGYFDYGQRFRRSVAISLEYSSLGSGSSSTARYSDG